MKTAISIPDPVFRAAERVAKNQGISRSQLYTMALKSYLEAKASTKIRQRLDEIYPKESSTLDPVLQKLQALSLPVEKW